VASVSLMPTEPQADQAHALAKRLAEPRTAAAINTLLDHADLLALLISGLDGLVSRSDTITESLADGVSELRAVSEPTRVNAAQLVATAKQLSALAPPLIEKLPVLEALLGSDLADLKVTGVVGLVRALRDPDVSRALGFVLSIAKALGKELDNA
jgi:uncharacterized protein YjgD (DUF1641 family)